MFRFLAGRNFIPQQFDPAGSPFRGLAEPGNAQGMLDSRLRGNDVLKKGDNLSAEDVAAGFTDNVIWNRFRVECLDIDGELPMECVDSGMVLLKECDSGNYGSPPKVAMRTKRCPPSRASLGRG